MKKNSTVVWHWLFPLSAICHFPRHGGYTNKVNVPTDTSKWFYQKHDNKEKGNFGAQKVRTWIKPVAAVTTSLVESKIKTAMQNVELNCTHHKHQASYSTKRGGRLEVFHRSCSVCVCVCAVSTGSCFSEPKRQRCCFMCLGCEWKAAAKWLVSGNVLHLCVDFTCCAFHQRRREGPIGKRKETGLGDTEHRHAWIIQALASEHTWTCYYIWEKYECSPRGYIHTATSV